MEKKQKLCKHYTELYQNTTTKENKHTPRPLFDDKLREHEKLAQIGGNK